MGDEAKERYAALWQECVAVSKKTRELRKQRRAAADTILTWMRSRDLDEYELPDGKLIRQTPKRTQNIHKGFIYGEIKRITGDDARAEAGVLNILSMCDVVEKETLVHLRKPRGPE